MITKCFFLLVFFGLAACDQWLVTSSCSAACSVLPSVNSVPCFWPPPPTQSSCDKTQTYHKFSLTQIQPIFSATKLTCSLHKNSDGSHYTWYNQTNNQKVQKWKCSDSRCEDCVKDKSLPTASLPIDGCSSEKESFYFITKGVPNMKDFYPKQRDPNQNWYRMTIDGPDCDPDNARSISYGPWKQLNTLAQDKRVFKLGEEGDCNDDNSVTIQTTQYCNIVRCDSQNSISSYEYKYNWDEKKCDFDKPNRVTEINLKGCDKCVQM